MSLLEARNLCKHFGGLVAVDDLDFDIVRGEILGLIGPNGAGKTTVFNMISGVYLPTHGKVVFKGEDITHLKADRVAAKGIARTFQLTTIYSTFTVVQNMLMAHHLHSKVGFLGAFLNTPSARRKGQDIVQKSMEILTFMGLDALKNEVAKNLPHGHQKALGTAMALAVQPELLLLDEPVAGMNPEETLTMMNRIGQIRERGITVLLVEHDMRAVMGLCDRILVLNYGRKIAEGRPEGIRGNRDVIEAYLGESNGGEEDA